MNLEQMDFSNVQCTACGNVGYLRIEFRWELTGPVVDREAPMTKWPWMVCEFCLSECKGKQ
ncbi:hypothetical protein SEA_WEASELS2_27 [Rhodococcus phage Weasels2]|uniref:Uncharacterized protein n=1 Tax=Rhodococcus phage Weasels2 TaxID=1897437 RepID=A0A1I9SA11_9CAUD|nr:hypothetical protein FDH04_gp027 [Rhodococcus phage Weasels2]AOZ63617.1 hypothetical protein SEA_WEASELS2_27 [Rhodococcus phage Weasels2]